jgi:hypothetical protein
MLATSTGLTNTVPQVGHSPLKIVDTIPELAQPSVALPAQNAAHIPGPMIMVDTDVINVG